jgi:serine/threonine protein kinase
MTVSFLNERDYSVYREQLAVRLEMPHSSLVRLFHFGTATEEDFCASIEVLSLYVEYEPRTLALEVARRQKKALYLDPAEARSLCWGMIRALSFLHRQNMFQGLLNCQRVVLCSRRFKFVDRLVTQQVIDTSDEKSLEEQLQHGFADPILLKCMYNKKTQMGDFDPFKSDVWSLGLVFLEALTLKPSLELYEIKKKLFY